MAFDQTLDTKPGPLTRSASWLYVLGAYLISWGGVWLIVSPGGIPGRPETLYTVFGLTFVAMTVGPPIASLLATAAFGGLPGVNDLFSRIIRWGVPPRYYLIALLLVPATAVAVDLVTSAISADFAPRLATTRDPAAVLLMGIGGGLVAGLLEEIGWTGFAVHRFLPRMGIWRAGIVLGVVHGMWHLLVGYWGDGANFGDWFLPYFLTTWLLGLVALRLLIVWLYAQTQSVLIGQIAHASYTGGLFILWPTTTAPIQVTIWGTVFSITLFLVVAALCQLAPSPPRQG